MTSNKFNLLNKNDEKQIPRKLCEFKHKDACVIGAPGVGEREKGGRKHI